MIWMLAFACALPDFMVEPLDQGVAPTAVKTPEAEEEVFFDEKVDAEVGAIDDEVLDEVAKPRTDTDRPADPSEVLALLEEPEPEPEPEPPERLRPLHAEDKLVKHPPPPPPEEITIERRQWGPGEVDQLTLRAPEIGLGDQTTGVGHYAHDVGIGGMGGGIVGGVVDGVAGGVEGGIVGGVVDGLPIAHHSELQVKKRIIPTYPKEALKQKLGSQRCMARVSIDAAGVPYDVVTERCPTVFHQPTKDALLQWRWYPYRSSATKEKTAVQITLAINYREK
jgi:hypothetical protein